MGEMMRVGLQEVVKIWGSKRVCMEKWSAVVCIWCRWWGWEG